MKAVFLSVVLGSVVSMNSIAAPSTGSIAGDLSKVTCANSFNKGDGPTLTVWFKNLGQTFGGGANGSSDKVLTVIEERSRYAADEVWLDLEKVVMTRELQATIPEDRVTAVWLESKDAGSYVRSINLYQSLKNPEMITGIISFGGSKSYKLECVLDN